MTEITNYDKIGQNYLWKIKKIKKKLKLPTDILCNLQQMASLGHQTRRGHENNRRAMEADRRAATGGNGGGASSDLLESDLSIALKQKNLNICTYKKLKKMI